MRMTYGPSAFLFLLSREFSKIMNLFDIVGPVMVGPSSSHTAGACRIGYVARKLLAEPVREAKILLYGSFLATGKGHGTTYAIVAGLLGMTPDDSRIPDSFLIAEQEGIKLSFGEAELKNGHPNSVMLRLKGVSGLEIEMVAESLGGGRINVVSIDGMDADFSGDYNTLIVYNDDKPGLVARVSGILAEKSINIATLKLHRSNRGGQAVMVIECDRAVSEEEIAWIRNQEGINKVTNYCPEVIK